MEVSALKKSIVSLIVVLLIIALLGCSAMTGLCIPGGFTTPAEDDTDSRVIIPAVTDQTHGIRLGLDLVGGSSITYEAIIPDDYSGDLTSDMNVAIAMVRARLTAQNYTEATVSLKGDNRIYVEIPNIKNPEEAVQVLGATAQMLFIDADGTVWMTGSDIKKAEYYYGQVSSSPVDQHAVTVEFTAEGATKFAEATASIAARTGGDNYLAILMDDTIVSMPYCEEAINSDSCVISGSFDQESAQNLADLINIGQLPFTLEQVELRSVGPQLGMDALRTSLIAGAIGIALIALFMLIVYRVPGLVACIGLAFYIAVEAVVFGLIHINLSLAGIAGILLSIGMAVDANVVIFERIKEELRAGKSIKASIDSGFHRAFAAILDSNVTTLIAAVVLGFMGTGTIVGFAMTLGIGVVVSMFTALTVTRLLLNAMANFGIRSPKAYGA